MYSTEEYGGNERGRDRYHDDSRDRSRGYSGDYEPRGHMNRSNGRSGGYNRRGDRHRDYGNGYRDNDGWNGGGGRRYDGERNGGGGYRRRRRNDSEEDYDRGSKRFRRDGPRHREPYESQEAKFLRRMKDVIVKVGDRLEPKSAKQVLKSNIEDLTETLYKDLEKCSDNIVNNIVSCAGRLPHKTAIYSTITGLLNVKNSTFGESIIKAVLKQLQKDIDFLSHNDEQIDTNSGMEDASSKSIVDKDSPSIFLRIRLLTRYLAELMNANVVIPEDFVFYVDSMQSVCVFEVEVDGDTENDNKNETEEAAAERSTLARYGFKDFFASVVLEALLYGGSVLSKRCSNEFLSLVSRCEEYIRGRESESGHFNKLLHLITPWQDETIPFEKFSKDVDPVQHLWDLLDACRNGEESEWKSLYPVNVVECFEDQLQNGKKHQLVLPTMNSKFNLSVRPFANPVYRLIDKDSGDIGLELSKVSTTHLHIIRTATADLLDAFHPSPSETARQLLAFARFVNGSLSSEDAPLNSQYLILETLFFQMLALPTPKRKPAFYAAVINELLKSDPAFMSPVFAILVELLFRRLSDVQVDASVMDCFCFWFSHFLSNFEFKWPWKNWEYVLDEDEDDQQRLFISIVLEKCVRLSYYQNIKKIIPANFHDLLPPEPLKTIKYHCPDEKDAADARSAIQDEHKANNKCQFEHYKELTTKLRAREDPTSVLRWISQQSTILQDQIDDCQTVMFEMFVQAILDVGSATFSHMRLLLDKYKIIFSSFINPTNEEAVENIESKEILVIRFLSEVWQNSPQHVAIIMDVLVRRGIVHSQSVATWLLTDDAMQQFSWPYVWEIVHNTIRCSQDFVAEANRQLKEFKPSEENMNDDDAMDSSISSSKEDKEGIVQRMKEQHEELLLSIFQGLLQSLITQVDRCESEGVDYKDNWYNSLLLRLKELGRTFRSDLDLVLKDVESNIIPQFKEKQPELYGIMRSIQQSY